MQKLAARKDENGESVGGDTTKMEVDKTFHISVCWSWGPRICVLEVGPKDFPCEIGTLEVEKGRANGH